MSPKLVKLESVFDAKLEVDCIDDIPDSLFYNFIPVNVKLPQ